MRWSLNGRYTIGEISSQIGGIVHLWISFSKQRLKLVLRRYMAYEAAKEEAEDRAEKAEQKVFPLILHIFFVKRR